ncbi:MAG: hypothetical protein AB1644_03575 [Candidatus Zixiibacteriota bacterium]
MVRFSVALSLGNRKRLGLVLVASALLMTLAVVIGVGCGKGKDETSVFNDPSYADWKTYTLQNVKIYYPPDHVFESQFPEIATNYVTATTKICSLLGMDPPKDTIVIFYYTGYGQGRDMTGQEYPFVKDHVIYFWLPSFLGPTLVDWLLPYWEKREPAFPFLKHGIRSLFDFSGQNYHKTTTGYVDDSSLIPLAKLVGDTAVNSDTERLQSGEAASFVAYILAYYGAARLKTMWESDKPFDQMVEQLFYIPVDSLQTVWVDFARQNTPPDTAAAN